MSDPSWRFGPRIERRLPGAGSHTVILDTLRVNGRAVRLEICVRSEPKSTQHTVTSIDSSQRNTTDIVRNHSQAVDYERASENRNAGCPNCGWVKPVSSVPVVPQNEPAETAASQQPVESNRSAKLKLRGIAGVPALSLPGERIPVCATHGLSVEGSLIEGCATHDSNDARKSSGTDSGIVPTVQRFSDWEGLVSRQQRMIFVLAGLVSEVMSRLRKEEKVAGAKVVRSSWRCSIVGCRHPAKLTDYGKPRPYCGRHQGSASRENVDGAGI